MGEFKESGVTTDGVYIKGSIGLSLDRIHVERTHNSRWDLVAYAGGCALAVYLAIYIVIYIYQKTERKIYMIKNIFYFTQKIEQKSLN